MPRKQLFIHSSPNLFMVWLDERSREEVHQFPAEIGPDLIHRTTGKPPDVTPVVYRLAWLCNNEPDVLKTCRWIADVHAFMLTGSYATSWASADPLGILDMDSKQWSEPILKKLGIDSQQLSDLVPPGGEIGEVTREAAEIIGLAPGIPVFAGGGDGQIASLGTGGQLTELNCFFMDNWKGGDSRFGASAAL